MINGTAIYAKQKLDDLVFNLQEEGASNIQIMNGVVSWLTEDITWIRNNISQVDRELLIKLGKFLEK